MPLRGDKLKKRPTGAIVGADPARAARREQSDIHQTGQCGVVLRPAACGLRTAGAFGAHQGRPLTSQTAFGGQLPYEGSLGRPAANSQPYTKRANVAWFCELRPAVCERRAL